MNHRCRLNDDIVIHLYYTNVNAKLILLWRGGWGVGGGSGSHTAGSQNRWVLSPARRILSQRASTSNLSTRSKQAPPPHPAQTPESRCLLNNLVKDQRVKGWGPGAEWAGVILVVREVVRHDLLKSGVAKPQGHPLVLWPIGAGRPTINLLCTLNPFNTHHDPDEEISSLREGHITLLALCIH